MKLDILAFGAHPDDVELSAAGTMVKHAALGLKTGVVDLTRGELGTRGTPELRLKEAAAAGRIMGLQARENLGMRDGFVENSEAYQLQVIEMIRKYQPEILLCNAPQDRHPDHGNACTLVREAAFKAGLKNIKTHHQGVSQEAWRPQWVYMYIQFQDFVPDFIVDITGYEDKKMDAIMAYGSQFYDPASKEPETVISSKGFKDSLIARTKEWGRQIYVEHGEGFLKERVLGVDKLIDLK